MSDRARPDIRPLMGWLLVADAAEEMGISRQSVNRMIVEGSIPTAHIRALGVRGKPIYILRERYVRKTAAERASR